MFRIPVSSISSDEQRALIDHGPGVRYRYSVAGCSFESERVARAWAAFCGVVL